MNSNRILLRGILCKDLTFVRRNLSVQQTYGKLMFKNKANSKNDSKIFTFKRLITTETNSASSSIDEEEMKRFQKLANNWWIENGEYEALHRMNTLRVPLIRDTLLNNRREYLEDKDIDKQILSSQPLFGLNILDIGCGGGILAEVKVNI
jgi:hypothetical protein